MSIDKIENWLKNKIDCCVETQSIHNKDLFILYHNNHYIRALKLSTITGQPVNKNNFNGGDLLFWFNIVDKTFGYSFDIREYLKINYSTSYEKREELIQDVLFDHEHFNDYVLG